MVGYVRARMALAVVRSNSLLMLGGAMLNGQKIKSPLISIKFGDILASAFDKT